MSDQSPSAGTAARCQECRGTGRTIDSASNAITCPSCSGDGDYESWEQSVPMVLNPEAIGDPDQTPVVRLPVGWRRP